MDPAPAKVNAMELLKMTSSPTQSVKRQLSLHSSFILEDDILYYQGKGKVQKVLFSPAKKWKAFEEAHVISEDRHHGIRATGVNITKSYYWPRITLQARQWVKECKKCQKDRLAEQEAQNAKSQVKAKKHKRKQPPEPETDSEEDETPETETDSEEDETPEPETDPEGDKIPEPDKEEPLELGTDPEKKEALEPWEDQLWDKPLEPREHQPWLPPVKRELSLCPPKKKLPPPAPRKAAPMAQARGLFHLIGLQFVGPMKQTPRGARFIFVAVDHFTRWVEAAPMKTCSPEETAKQILKLVHRFGFPERIISSRSSGFVRKLNQILRMQTNLRCDLVAKYHPQAHGLLEETNAFVKRLLTLVVRRSAASWDLQLPNILFLQKKVEEESEADLSSEDELEEGWDSDESLPPALFPTDSSELPPDKKSETVLSVEGTCLYCNQLTAEGNCEVFTMLQCNKCQAWAHQTCVKQWHSNEDWKSRFQCKACLPGHEHNSAPAPE